MPYVFSFRRGRLDLEVDIEQRPQIWMAWPGWPGTRLKTCCKGQHPGGLEDVVCVCVCVRRYMRRNGHSFASVRAIDPDVPFLNSAHSGQWKPADSCASERAGAVPTW